MEERFISESAVKISKSIIDYNQNRMDVFAEIKKESVTKELAATNEE